MSAEKRLFDENLIPFSVTRDNASDRRGTNGFQDRERPLFAADVDCYLGQKTRTRGQGGRAWTNLYLADTVLKPKNEDFKIKPDIYGVQVGFDVVKSHGTYLTFFYNFNQSKTKYDDWLRSKIQNHLVGLGYSVYLSACHFGIIGGIGYDDYTATDETTSIKYDGNGMQTNLFAEFGVDLVLGSWKFIPFYALQYDFLYHGRLGEPGEVLQSDWNGHSFVQLMGLRVNWQALENLRIQFRSTWIHEMLNHPQPFYNARFSAVYGTSTPSIFFYNGSVGRDWAWLGTGLKFEFYYNAMLFLDYDATLNGRGITHLGSLGLCFGW